MTVVRHGNRLGFWDGTSAYNATTNPNGGVGVPIGASSPQQEIGRTGNSLSVYVKVANPGFITKWQIQAAHSGGLYNANGEPLDETLYDANLDWHDAWYYGMVPTSEPYGTQGATNLQFWIPATGGAVVNMVPDWVAGWIRLTRIDVGNAPVTVQAGWEVESE